MNKIFTLLVMGMLCLAVNTINAQVNENFTATLPNCWIKDNTTQINISSGNSQPNYVAAFTNNGVAILGTPYINVTNGSLNIFFNYRISSNKVQAGKTRTIQVGYQAKGGNFVPLTGFIDVSIAKNFTAFQNNNSNTFTIPNGIYRIVIKGTADGADDNIWIDDLRITGGTYYYGSTPCNTPPQTEGDIYTVTGYGTHVIARSVLENDKDLDNKAETLKAVSVTMDPTQGTINLNEDGTFVYKPHPTFMGSFATFTYRAVDNGYDPATSAETTVRINIVEGIILPVKLINFSGSLVNQKVQLAWQVADNETGSHFEVQKSNDGKNFAAQSIVFCSAKTGTEAYQFTDATLTSEKAYYRLKTVNKDGSVSYSKVLYLSSAGTDGNNKITLLQNPVQSTLTFAFTAATAEENEIAIYNMAGIKLHTQKVKAVKGTNQISIDTNANWSTGTYVLTVRSATAQRVTRFVK